MFDFFQGKRSLTQWLTLQSSAVIWGGGTNGFGIVTPAFLAITSTAHESSPPTAANRAT
jgi:hypothetical protein